MACCRPPRGERADERDQRRRPRARAAPESANPTAPAAATNTIQISRWFGERRRRTGDVAEVAGQPDARRSGAREAARTRFPSLVGRVGARGVGTAVDAQVRWRASATSAARAARSGQAATPTWRSGLVTVPGRAPRAPVPVRRSGRRAPAARRPPRPARGHGSTPPPATPSGSSRAPRGRRSAISRATSATPSASRARPSAP